MGLVLESGVCFSVGLVLLVNDYDSFESLSDGLSLLMSFFM